MFSLVKSVRRKLVAGALALGMVVSSVGAANAAVSVPTLSPNGRICDDVRYFYNSVSAFGQAYETASNPDPVAHFTLRYSRTGADYRLVGEAYGSAAYFSLDQWSGWFPGPGFYKFCARNVDTHS